MNSFTHNALRSLCTTLTLGIAAAGLVYNFAPSTAQAADTAPAPVAVAVGNFNTDATLNTGQIIAADTATCATVGGTWTDTDKPYPWCAL